MFMGKQKKQCTGLRWITLNCYSLLELHYNQTVFIHIFQSVHYISIRPSGSKFYQYFTILTNHQFNKIRQYLNQYKMSKISNNDFLQRKYSETHNQQQYIRNIPQILSQIIAIAQQNFIKEAKLNLVRQPTFNILKVLSAFKQLYPNNNQPIYNAIMLIVHQYRPRNMNDWLWAIKQMEKQIQDNNNKKSNKIINTIKISKADNDSPIIRHISHNSSRSKSSIHSQMLVGSYKVGEFKKPQQQGRCSKLHYMSFHPEDNKENIQGYNYIQTMGSLNHHNNYQQGISEQAAKSTQNIPSKSTINISYNILNHQKTKSSFQLHQNFAKQKRNNKMSHQSQLLINKYSDYHNNLSGTILNKSKITVNTKEVTDMFMSEVNSEQQRVMNLRADIFYRINSEMKAFSAFLANFAAFFQFRESLSKARHFLQSNIKSKAIYSLKQNVKQNKIQRQNERKSDNFNKIIVLKRVYGIFKILHQTKVQSVRKHIPIQKYNIINYQFIITLIISQLKQTTDKQIKINQRNQTPRSLPTKAKYFDQQGHYSKLITLLSHFGYYSPTLEQITKFNLLKNTKIQERCFQKWKNIFQIKVKYRQRINNKLLRRCFSVLNQQKQKTKKMEQIRLAFKTVKQKNILHKVFNLLVQCVYSTKIYRERFNYLSEYSKKTKKEQVFKKLVEQYKLVNTKRQEAKLKINKFNRVITNITFKCCFTKFTQHMRLQRQNNIKNQEFAEKKLIKSVFQVFKQKLTEAKTIRIIQRRNNTVMMKMALKKWQNKFFICKGIKIITIITERLNLQRLLKVMKNLKIRALINKQKDCEIVRLTFQSLKINMLSEEELRQNKTSKVRKIFQDKRYKQFSVIVSLLGRLQKNKLRLENSLKKNSLNKFIKNTNIQCRKNYFETQVNLSRLKFKISYRKMKYFTSHQSLLKKKISELSILRKSLCSTQLFNILKNNLHSSTLKSRLMKIQSSKFKINTIFMIKHNVLNIKQRKILIKNQNKILSKTFQAWKNQHLNHQKCQKNARFLYFKTTVKKVLVQLVNGIIENDTKILNLKNFIIKQTKHRGLLTMFQHTDEKKDLKQSSKKLAFYLFLKQMKINKIFRDNVVKIKKLVMRNYYIVCSSRILQCQEYKLKNLQRCKYFNKCSKQIQGKRFYCRFSNFFVETMLNRKYECMTIKFRVLKLLMKAIKSLQSNFNEKRGNKISNYRCNRINVSTQYSNQ